MANILKIYIRTDKSICYLLTYDKSEAGIKSDEFWTPNWKVAHQCGMGRFKNDSRQIILRRKKLPTNTYFNESSEITEYHIKRKKVFEFMTTKCGNHQDAVCVKL